MFTMSRWTLLSLLLLATVTAFFASVISLVTERSATVQILDGSGAVRYEKWGLVYVYHPLTDTEGLYALAEDPKLLRNLVAARPREVRRLRREVCDRLGLSDLTELRVQGEETLEWLRGLGYL